MFSFDEELFSKAYDKSKELLEELNTKKSDIVELRNMIGQCDYESNIETILTDIENITNTIDELNIKMMWTLTIVGNGNIGGRDLNIEKLISCFSFFYGSVPGEYGANQSGAYLLFRQYLKDPDKLSETDKKRIETILEVFNDYDYILKNEYFYNVVNFCLGTFSLGGCGPASLANVVMDAYSKMQDGEEIFEQKYGFPMYITDNDGNKRYNYDALFVKLNLDDMSDSFSDTYIPIIHDWCTYVQSLSKMPGMFTNDLKVMIQDELDDNFEANVEVHEFFHWYNTLGIGSKFKDVVNDYQKNKDNYDYCIVSAHGFKLIPYNDLTGEAYGNVEMPSAGHYMTVIGISENNNLIVSSWGYQFELVSSNYSDLIYINVDPKENKVNN